MAHPEQKQFFEELSRRFSSQFESASKILEIGSQDINGTVRDFFPNGSEYLGIDIGPGKCVDLIIPGELIQLPDNWADITISTECFEHAQNWQQVLENMIRITRPTGLVILTFAGFERTAHGTLDSLAEWSPYTASYYKNLIPEDIYQAIQVGRYFASHAFEVNSQSHDTYFWGIRNDQPLAVEPDTLRTLEEKLVRAQGQLGQSVQKIVELNHQIAERENQITNLRLELDARGNALVERNQSLEAKESEIIQLNQQISHHEQQLAAVTQQFGDQIKERDSRIVQLDQQRVERDTSIAHLSQQLAERETTILGLHEQMTGLNTEVASLKPLLQQRENQVVSLTSRLDSSSRELLAIHQSMSWKMLAPVRTIGVRYPRLAKANRRLFKVIWWTVTLQLPARLLPRLKFYRRYFRDIRLIQNSQLLDVDWYLSHYPDVGQTGVSPLQHYLQFGAYEGRDPNPLFDSDWYLRQYPDVAQAGVNPLRHYIQFGAYEGRDPNPLFDSDWYLRRYPDVAQAGVNPLRHYLYYGAQEGRDPSPAFDSDWYLKHYPDVAAAGLNPLHHYLWSGKAEGRQPISVASKSSLGGLFDSHFYRANALAELNQNDEEAHYLNQGILRGSPPNRQVAQRRLERQPSKPLISILMPTYNTPAQLITEAVDSVRQQTYENWELCIQDDGSTAAETLKVLKGLPDLDSRIHVNFSQGNQGIAAATNSALDVARGEFIAMMDHDDLLPPNALADVVVAYNQHPDTDVFYTDQALIDDSGQFTQHHYKPDWSPWMFRGVMYVGHLLVVRRRIAQEVGGFDSNFDFVQDFEFMLRVSEATRRIVHIPKVLYFWRQTAESIAGGGKTDINFGALQSRAVNAHCERLSLPVHATPNPVHPHRLVLEPTSSVEAQSVRVLVLPDPLSPFPTDEVPAHRLAGWTAGDGIDVCWTQLQPEDLEDASRLNALLHDCPCDVWVFMNSQCKPAQNDWLKRLTGYVALPGVGAAGPLMIDGDGKVAVAGMVLTKAGAQPAMQGLNPGADGYGGSLSCLREVSALSPDCIVLRKQILSHENGFFPEFGLAYNLLDMGIRCQQVGLTNLVIPFVTVKFTNGAGSCLEDASTGERFWKNYRYPTLNVRDGFYPSGLASEKGAYALAH
jgi:predicted  nucleic acid-binding Zn-ribbon protein